MEIEETEHTVCSFFFPLSILNSLGCGLVTFIAYWRFKVDARTNNYSKKNMFY